MKELVNIINSKFFAVIDELKAQRNTLELKLSNIKEDIDDKVAIASDYKDKVEKSNNTISDLEDKIKKLEADLKDLHDKFDSAGFTELLEAGNKEINGKIIEYSNQIQNEKDNIMKLQDEAANLKDELVTLKDSRDNIENELNNTIVALNYYDSKVVELTIFATDNADKLAELTKEDEELDMTSPEDDVDVNKIIDGKIFEEIDSISKDDKELSEEELENILNTPSEEESEEVEEEPKEDEEESKDIEDAIHQTQEIITSDIINDDIKPPMVEEDNNEDLSRLMVEDDDEDDDEDTKILNLDIDVPEEKEESDEYEKIEVEEDKNPPVEEQPKEEVVETPAEVPTIPTVDNSEVLEELGFDLSLFSVDINSIPQIDKNKGNKIKDLLDVHFIDINNIYQNPNVLNMDYDKLSKILDTLEYSGCIPSTITYIFKYLDKIDVDRLVQLTHGDTDSVITILINAIDNPEIKDIGDELGLNKQEKDMLISKLTPDELLVMNSFTEITKTNYNTLKGLNINELNKCFTEHPKRFMLNPDRFEAILDKYDPQDLVRCINKNVAVIDKL